jgi:uncharacterized protein YxjI
MDYAIAVRIDVRKRRGDAAVHYRMPEKLVAIGDDHWIKDEQRRRCYKISGKALRVRDTLAIEEASGKTVATDKKARIGPLRERFDVLVDDRA